MTVVDYDALVADYAARLATVLRGFSTGPEFLEAWVPDEDPVRGVSGVLAAAAEAALPSITVVVGAATAKRCSDWRSALERWGEVTVRSEGAGLRISVTLGPTRPAAARPERERTRRRAALRGPSTAPAPEVLPARFRDGVMAASASATHEGKLDGDAVVHARRDGAELSLELDEGGIVRVARFANPVSPELRGVLELLCRVAEGLPVQELAEHGALRVALLAAAPGTPPPVPGIVQPQNASTLLDLAERLSRDAYAASGRRAEDNRWQPAPSAAWLELDDDERRARVDAVLEEICAALRVPPTTFEVQGVRDVHKVRVDVDSAIPAAERRRLLLALELELAARVEPTLIVERQARPDLNKIRRL